MIKTKVDDQTFEIFVANVISVYRSASEQQLAKGEQWYPVAHGLAVQLFGDAKVGAGVLASLSANKGWHENCRLAADAAEGNVHGHVGAQLRKVSAILSGTDPEDVLPMSKKTGHFYRCILDPADPDAVVIDRHAHDIALGKALGNADRGLSTQTRYDTLADVYRAAAGRLGVLPSVLQAVTWVAWTEAIAGTSTRGPRKD